MKFSEKKNPALVLSGGGIKAAAFHVGVCLALQEKGFGFAGGTTPLDSSEDDSLTFKTYVGSSAGALVSTILASGYSIEALVEAFEMGSTFKSRRRSKKDSPTLKPFNYWDIFSVNGANLLRFFPSLMGRNTLVTGGIEALLKNGFKINGIFTTKGLERYLRTYVVPTNDFRELNVKLFITATQLNHSRKVIFGGFDSTEKQADIKWANYATISEAVAASASLPPVFAPYGIKDQQGREFWFFDGEIRDTLSTHVAVDNGADLVIASYSMQPYHYNEKMGSLHKYGIPIILNQALYQLVEQKILRHIKHKKDLSVVINTVDGYFRQAGLPEEHRAKLLDILCEKLNFKPNIEHIYIHPDPKDYEMFFVDHFSLNKEILSRIVRIGFRAALRALRQHNI